MVLKSVPSLDRGPCLAQIENSYSQLRGSVRQVADTLLRSPADWVGKSISELARASSVSEATVVRFVRGLGYTGFRAFGIAFAGSVSPAQPQAEQPGLKSAPHDNSLSGIVKRVFEEESQALAQAPKTLKSEILERAVLALINARQVYAYGVGGSDILASVAEYRLVRLGINCISIRDPIQMAIQTSLLSSKDVVLAFSQTGRDRDAVDGVLLARQAGATTITVSSEPGSPLVRVAEIPLVLFELSTSDEVSLLDTRIAELTLIDALASCISLRRKTPLKEVRRVDKQIEKMLTQQTTSHRTRAA